MLILRQADELDCLLLFELANDSTTRLNSIETSRIEWEGHRQWFFEKLNSNLSQIYIAMLAEVPIGQVRFDLWCEEWILDYSVAREYRGRGWGKVMLGIAINALMINTGDRGQIVAYVRPANFASARILQSLNFVYEADSVRGEVLLHRYRYRKPCLVTIEI